jgi:hypothetical protein
MSAKSAAVVSVVSRRDPTRVLVADLALGAPERTVREAVALPVHAQRGPLFARVVAGAIAYYLD